VRMLEPAKLSFVVQPFEGTLSVTPAVNGSLLSDLVLGFEQEHHFEPAGGYGGLVPTWFDYGPLHSYFLGDFAPGAILQSKVRFTSSAANVGKWAAGHCVATYTGKTTRSSGRTFNNHIAQSVTTQNSGRTFLQNRSTWTHWDP
jgi:hypothetical protein